MLDNVCHYISRAFTTHIQLMSVHYTTQIQPHCGSPTPTENKHAQTRSQVLMTLPAERISFCMYSMAPAANRSCKLCKGTEL